MRRWVASSSSARRRASCSRRAAMTEGASRTVTINRDACSAGRLPAGVASSSGATASVGSHVGSSGGPLNASTVASSASSSWSRSGRMVVMSKRQLEPGPQPGLAAYRVAEAGGAVVQDDIHHAAVGGDRSPHERLDVAGGADGVPGGGQLPGDLVDLDGVLGEDRLRAAL